MGRDKGTVRWKTQRLKDRGGERWIHHPQMKAECPVSPDSPSEGVRSSRGFLGVSPAGGQAEQSGQFGMCSWSTVCCLLRATAVAEPRADGPVPVPAGNSAACAQSRSNTSVCAPQSQQPGSFCGGTAVRSWRFCLSRNLWKGEGQIPLCMSGLVWIHQALGLNGSQVQRTSNSCLLCLT